MRVLPWVLAVATILGHQAWPLTSGQWRVTLTIITVITSFLASVSHAFIWRGPLWTGGYLATTLGIGWGVEAFGTATGALFGSYHYTDALGVSLLGVPLIIPMAWSMMAYPCLLATQRLVRSKTATALLGGYLFTTWDIFLDPQMVGEGYWRWARRGRYRGIPLSNFVGWFLTGLVVMAVLERALPVGKAPTGEPDRFLVAQYGAMAAMETLGFAAFFRDRLVALVGGAAMVPLATVALRRS